MADDPNPALRAELNAALAIVVKQIDGLQVLVNSSISAALLTFVQNELAIRTRRRDLILATIKQMDLVLDALNALGADGYPTFAVDALPPDLAAELAAKLADIESGAGVFGPAVVMPATRLSVSLGSPASKE